MRYGPNKFPLAVNLLIRWRRPIALLLGLLLIGWAIYDFRSQLVEIQERRKDLNRIKEIALELQTQEKNQPEVNNAEAP